MIIKLVAGGGLEPPTFGLWAQRAANCSTPRYLALIYYTTVVVVLSIELGKIIQIIYYMKKNSKIFQNVEKYDISNINITQGEWLWLIKKSARKLQKHLEKGGK